MKQEWLPRDEWLKLHTVYLRSSAWKDVRERALRRDSYACQICGGGATQVHHLTYKRWRHEQLFDVVSLCEKCHGADHAHPMRAPRVVAITCWRCGEARSPWDGSIYLAAWARKRDPAVIVGNEPDNETFDAGLFCNGKGKCRDIVDSLNGGSQFDVANGDGLRGKVYSRLGDLPTRGVLGEWAVLNRDMWMLGSVFTHDAAVKMNHAVRILSAIPTDRPYDPEDWVGDGKYDASPRVPFIGPWPQSEDEAF